MAIGRVPSAKLSDVKQSINHFPETANKLVREPLYLALSTVTL
jgi:hypothetical protein